MQTGYLGGVGGGFFGIGATEAIVVVVLALVLFSPKELPGIIRSIAKFWGSIKRTADEFKDAIMQEESLQDIKDVYQGTKTSLRKAETDARRELMKARTEMRKAQGKLAKMTKVRQDVEKQATEAVASTDPTRQAVVAESDGADAKPDAKPEADAGKAEAKPPAEPKPKSDGKPDDSSAA